MRLRRGRAVLALFARVPAFAYEMPVRFSDVDHAGIVYYPVFFHYFHVAFEELFRDRLGARAYVDVIERERIGFPAVSARCDYRAPLAFGDTVRIELSISRLGDSSATFRYRALRVASDGDDVLAAAGEVVCAIVDLEKFQSVTTPEWLRAMFLELS